MAIFNPKRALVWKVLLLFMCIGLAMVTLLNLFTSFWDETDFEYVVVVLPQSSKTPARYCVRACTPNTRYCTLQRFVDGSSSICISHDGNAKLVYSSVGTRTRAFERYDLTCDDGSTDCVTIKIDDYLKDCSIIYDVFAAAEKNNQASGPGYTITKQALDREIWGQMCNFSMYRGAFGIMVVIVVFVSILSILRGMCSGQTLLQRQIEEAELVICGTNLWDTFGGVFAHLLKNWMLPIVLNLYFAVNVVLYLGIQYNPMELTSAYLGMVTGILSTIIYLFWIHLMIGEYKNNPAFAGDYRQTCIHWLFEASVWFSETGALCLALFVLKSESDASSLKWIAPFLKSVLQMWNFYSLLKMRPCGNARPLLDGKAEYVALSDR